MHRVYASMIRPMPLGLLQAPVFDPVDLDAGVVLLAPDDHHRLVGKVLLVVVDQPEVINAKAFLVGSVNFNQLTIY